MAGLLLSGCVSSDGPPIPPEGFTTSIAQSGDPIVGMPVTDVASPTPVATYPVSETAAASLPAGEPTAARFPASTPQPAPVPQASADLSASGTPAQPQRTQPSVASIRFTPVIGAPLQVVKPLSSELAVAARNRNITIRTSSDASSDNILRGYFSALNDGSKTTVVYVWDILDNAGNRLHRIQGRESVPGTAADPWTAVPASTMQAIANRTIDEYLAWRNSGSG